MGDDVFDKVRKTVLRASLAKYQHTSPSPEFELLIAGAHPEFDLVVVGEEERAMAYLFSRNDVKPRATMEISKHTTTDLVSELIEIEKDEMPLALDATPSVLHICTEPAEISVLSPVHPEVASVFRKFLGIVNL